MFSPTFVKNLVTLAWKNESRNANIDQLIKRYIMCISNEVELIVALQDKKNTIQFNSTDTTLLLYVSKHDQRPFSGENRCSQSDFELTNDTP